MTGSADTLTAQALSALRHDLRTPINQIIGYCEMLLEDAAAAELASRRRALEEALAAVRDALTTIDRALPSGRDDVRTTEAEALTDTLRVPREKILQATDALLSDADRAFVADVRKIRSAAERLGLTGTAGATPAGGTPKPQPPTAKPQTGTPSHPASIHPAPSQSGASTPAAPARILVVDDIEDNRAVLERRLARQGYAVTCAASGGAALALLAATPFDLVLLDVMMPELDGFAVLERIKGAEETRDIPVIMISALDDMASVVRCIERGAEDYLPKPFDPVLLKARIGASLEKKRLRDRELAYLKEVERVIAAARAVEGGEYRTGALADLASRADELGRLARVFDGMAAGVKAREDRLQGRLDELRREIAAARPAAAPAEAAAATALQAGQLFAGRYEIVRPLGAGGMGAVYLARDRELGEDVAVKMLHAELLGTDETATERLKAETRLARKISHRNVVRTHDFGVCDGACYVTMEYVEGMTVRQLLETRGRLGVSAVLALGSQLAEALDVAHRQGVVHRDIKPQNLLLDAEGVLKVMDFGVARLVEHTTVLTQAGMVVGTPAYMSPEQLLAEDVDGRSDLYSAGVVLYECLTGRLPFEAHSPISLIAKLLHDEAEAPAALNADVPLPLSALVLRLLAKKADERPRSAAELSGLLAQLG
ncbi:MAG TPA: protein kinase [Gemmatimonadales bacterium]|nr:protein kinase [Gemmatimonadales bacterium]